MTFGERLKELREASGFSQSVLAKEAGVGLATVKDYEGNRRTPSLEIAQTLARVLGVSCQAFDGCEFQHAKQRMPGQATSKEPKPRGRLKKAAGQGKRKK